MSALLRMRRPLVLAAALVAATALAPPSPAAASSVCPPAPRTLAALISPDAVHSSPLTDQFRPVYGVYAEAAAACWGDEDIAVVGYVATPEGLGGASAFTIEPAWIVGRAHFLSTTDGVDPDAGPVGPFFPVAVPRSLEAEVQELHGRWVGVTGHFLDPLAETCTVTRSNPDLGAVPTAEEAVEICRTSFVLTAIEAFAAPATDTRPDGDIARGPTSTALHLALAFGVSLVIALRRYPSIRVGRSR